MNLLVKENVVTYIRFIEDTDTYRNIINISTPRPLYIARVAAAALEAD